MPNSTDKKWATLIKMRSIWAAVVEEGSHVMVQYQNIRVIDSSSEHTPDVNAIFQE